VFSQFTSQVPLERRDSNCIFSPGQWPGNWHVCTTPSDLLCWQVISLSYETFHCHRSWNTGSPTP